MHFKVVKQGGKFFVARGSKFWRSTEKDSHAEALDEAARRSAMWHMRQVKIAMESMTRRDSVVEVGHECIHITDIVTDMFEDDPDPTGWKA